MSLSTLDDWLKPSPEVAQAHLAQDEQDDVEMGLRMPDAVSSDLPMPLPTDLGLPSLSAEDIKWVDLEFLDLASGPMANQERSRNKNPTLGDIFPDIFFDTTSSLFNPIFSSEPFKDHALDLEMGDLFPSSSSIVEQTANDACASHPAASGAIAPERLFGDYGVRPSSGVNELSNEEKSDIKDRREGVEGAKTASDGVFPMPVDVLSLISKDLPDLQYNFEKNSSEEACKPFSEVKVGPEENRPLRVQSIKKFQTPVPDNVLRRTLAKIAIQTNRSKDTTLITILPGPKQATGGGHSFEINTSNLRKATGLLRPLHLDRLPVFSNVLPQQSTERQPAAVIVKSEEESEQPRRDRDSSTSTSEVKEVRLEKDQAAIQVLATHGIELAGLMCVTTNDGRRHWLCPEKDCDKAFSRPSKLKDHLLSHRAIKPFRCSVAGCAWAFVTKAKLQRHMDSHSREKSFACKMPGCDVRFSTIYNLRKHLFIHTQAPLTCQQCSESFCSKRSLEKHVRTHKEVAGAHKCEVAGCGGSFHSPVDLKSHGKAHSHPPDSLVCGVCHKAFKKPSLLTAHMRFHTGSRPFRCQAEGCLWAFATKSKLSRHERTHNNVRNHICDICSKGFIRREHLRDHLLSHSNSKGAYVCPLGECKLQFGDKNSLYIHMKEHSEDGISYTTFRCVVLICTHKFSSRRELSMHLRVEHAKDFPAPPPTETATNTAQELATVDPSAIAALKTLSVIPTSSAAASV